MIDLHAHILPGLDDGARSIEESRELARRAAQDGVEAIAATPHVRSDYPTSADQMERGVAELRRDFAKQGIEVSLLHGGEIDLEQLEVLQDEEIVRFTLAQTGRYVLVEFPYRGWPLVLERTVFRLRLRGFQVVLAHPERNPEVQERPDRLQTAVGAGALVQITAAAIDGRLGRSSEAAAYRLLERRLAHVLASDAHTLAIREPGLRGAAKALRDETIVRYLTEEVPAAIVAGRDVAPPPVFKRKRFNFS